MSERRVRARTILNKRHAVYKSWSLVSEELGGFNRGMLCKVAKGKKPASRPLIDRMNEVYHLHLPYETKIEVVPLSCGHAPLRKSCPICNQKKYAPHPVMRLSRLRAILTSPYKDS